MLDVFNIPGQQDNVKVYYTQGTTAWQTWTKPRNCKFVWMMCIGGGGGGGGGLLGASAAASCGGGSGAVTRALFPANVLPDILFIQPGPGGTAGAAATVLIGGTGGNGNASYISITPSAAVPMNVVCTSGGATRAIGGQGQGQGGITANGEVVASTTQAGLLSLGNFISVAGQQATGAGTTPVGHITPLGSTITTAGGAASGTSTTGSVASPGGDILATSISPLITSGSSGIVSWKPFYTLGGAGAPANDGQVGLPGGDGSYGSGGGGGSAGNTSAGAGGRGGDGLVIIATF